jgi:ABC-type Fe3+/spermidine/putrescine transport system ATPase subunit
MSGLSLRGLTVLRDRRVVVEDVSFTAPAGRLTALLGGKGAGKTSLLMAAAGLIPAERGSVLMAGKDVTRRRGPRKRGIALLSPGTGMDVSARAGAWLQRQEPKASAGRLGQILTHMDLAYVSHRRVAMLSHGEQFAVLAAARMLPAGDVLLIDEAGTGLGHADRMAMIEILRRRVEEGATVILATRDETLAAAADHLVLLHAGHVVQAETPASCYAEPRTAEAAHLTGPANILEGTVRERRAGGYVWTAEGGRFLQAARPDTVQPPLGSFVRFCLRPERMSLLLSRSDVSDNALPTAVRMLRNAGSHFVLDVETVFGPMSVSLPGWPPPPAFSPGEEVTLGWSGQAATVLES